MAKTYLQSYEAEKFQALNSDGITYILYCTKINFWGIKTDVEIKYTIPHLANSGRYFERWNQLIDTQKPLT